VLLILPVYIGRVVCSRSQLDQKTSVCLGVVCSGFGGANGVVCRMAGVRQDVVCDVEAIAFVLLWWNGISIQCDGFVCSSNDPWMFYSPCKGCNRMSITVEDGYIAPTTSYNCTQDRQVQMRLRVGVPE
jgi:hypothetical protein